jgi:CHAD domain-containing protein
MPPGKPSRGKLTDFLEDYCERQTPRLLADLRTAFVGREREGVHNLRVDVKRLRAYVRLIDRIAPGFDAPAAYRPVRRLFRSSSTLRDIQIQIGFLAGKAAFSFPAERLNEWYNELKSREMKARRPFEAEARKFSLLALTGLKNWVAGSLKGIPEGMVAARAEQSLQTQLRRMRDLASAKQLTDQELHQTRIRSKEARYTLEMIDQGGGRPEARVGLNDKLRAVHQALGRWHDRQVAFDGLTDFLQNRASWPVNNPDHYGAYLSWLRQNKLAALQDFRLSSEQLVANLH